MGTLVAARAFVVNSAVADAIFAIANPWYKLSFDGKPIIRLVSAADFSSLYYNSPTSGVYWSPLLDGTPWGRARAARARILNLTLPLSDTPGSSGSSANTAPLASSLGRYPVRVRHAVSDLAAEAYLRDCWRGALAAEPERGTSPSSAPTITSTAPASRRLALRVAAMPLEEQLLQVHMLTFLMQAAIETGKPHE